MKKIFLISLLLIGQLSYGQKGKLVEIPGTKCSMVPPDGFVPATSFSGFQDNETGATIMINELPAPYQTIVSSLSADALKARGMTLISKQAIDFNNSNATLVNIAQSANGTKYIKLILIFEDAGQTILVNGVFPEASTAIEAMIKEALLSTVYDANKKDNPLEAAAFTIDISNTEFKLIKYLAGSLLYSTDGKIPTEKPTLIVANSLSKVPLGDQKRYTVERLRQLPGGEKSLIKEFNDVVIDNLKGYEIIADGKTRADNPELVYQVMLFNDNGAYYIIVGQAKEDFQKYIETFRQVSRTFKRK